MDNVPIGYFFIDAVSILMQSNVETSLKRGKQEAREPGGGREGNAKTTTVKTAAQGYFAHSTRQLIR
jgi:hypothetical protein